MLRRVTIGIIATASAALSVPAFAAPEAWRIEQSLNAPDWLEVSGNARLRYETLDGQFRAGRDGSDQLVASRILVHTKIKTEHVTFGLEIQDARSWKADAGSPLSTSFVNAAEPLQAYADLSLDSVLGREADLKLGRFTLDVGSRRFVERNSFRNTINAYDGAHFRTALDERSKLEVFYVRPVRKEPRDRQSLDDNDIQLDETNDAQQFWGVYFQRKDIWPQFAPGVTGEIFAYGLNEKDIAERQSPDRELFYPGFRVFKKPSTEQWDFEVEAATRFGSRRATSDPADTSKLDVRAHMLHAEAGYTFDGKWNPRVSLEYDLATGDKNPDNNTFGTWERLFGTRRGDLGNTSIHGPLTRSNVSVPGIRLSVTDKKKIDARLKYQAAYLASGKEAFVVGRLRDATGASGNFLGHTLDGRVRYWLKPNNLRLEVGGSLLLNGEFLDNVPGGPTKSRTIYGYTQLTASF